VTVFEGLASRVKAEKLSRSTPNPSRRPHLHPSASPPAQPEHAAKEGGGRALAHSHIRRLVVEQVVDGGQIRRFPLIWRSAARGSWAGHQSPIPPPPLLLQGVDGSHGAPVGSSGGSAPWRSFEVDSRSSSCPFGGSLSLVSRLPTMTIRNM
jgi:hypothetical protein